MVKLLLYLIYEIVFYNSRAFIYPPTCPFLLQATTAKNHRSWVLCLWSGRYMYYTSYIVIIIIWSIQIVSPWEQEGSVDRQPEIALLWPNVQRKKNVSEWHRMCFRSPSQQHAQLTSPRQQSVRTYSIQILFICVPYKMIDSTRSRTAQIHRELNGNVTVHISSLWTAKASPGSFNNRTRSTLACSLSTEKWNFLDASCICLCHWHEWVAASSSSHRSLQKWQGPEGLQSSTVLQSWCLPPAQWRIKFTSSKCPDKIH